ncbi:MAG: BrnA antitoxin family protein [Acidobacteriia bacterium]|nr:BrnA antitoxin family protein [Terriglobia bacterium]
MKVKASKKRITDREFYDKQGILGKMIEKDVPLSLDQALRRDILLGKRKRRLRNVTIKIDPLYLISVKKVATRKGIPYQTLVRQWVAEEVRKELKIA